MEREINNIKYKVYFQGNISEDSINLIHTPKEKIFTEKAKEIIGSKWEEQSKVSCYKCYDGDCIDLIDVKMENGKLNIHLDYTKYSLTLVARNPEYQKENCYLSNHISIPTIIKTSDNKFIFITSKDVRNGKYHWKFVGGFWEKQAPKISGLSLILCQISF